VTGPVMPRKDILEEYLARTPTSKKLYEEAKDLIPGGVGSGFRFFEPYPFFIKKAKGSKMWDVDGNEYIDYLMGYGPLVGGHANPIILEAIREQMEDGIMYTMPHEKNIEFLRELKRRYPMMGMFRLTNSGTESTMHAIRLARGYTGKDKIIKIEGAYHGAHDYVLVSVTPPLGKVGPVTAPTSVPQGEGIPRDVVKNTIIVPYNNTEVLERVLKKYEGEIAAMIVEPVVLNDAGVVLPKEGYLRDVRKLTEEYNVLLIFDEVKTGVRLAPGGAAEYFKIEPDIVTLAKAIGGGVPLGAFGAKKEIMESIFPLGHVTHAGTYNTNPLAVAAGIATLKKILTDQAYAYMKARHEELVKGLRDQLEDSGVEGFISEICPMGYIYFAAKDRKVDEVYDYRSALLYCDLQKTIDFWFSMINRGVIMWAPCQLEQWNVTVAHTKEDIEKTVELAGEALNKIKE